MDVTTPVAEDLLIYAGQAACILSSLYMAKIGEIKISVVLILAFILQIQSSYVLPMIDSDVEGQGECWALVGSYYECLPLAHRISIHAAQVGTLLLGLGIFMSARRLS